MKLQFKGAEKIYAGGYVGLLEFDLTIDSGDGVFTVLGAEQSGKTTFALLIAGLEKLSGGSIYLDGTRFDTSPPKRRNVCITGGAGSLSVKKSVEYNLCRSLLLRGFTTSEAAKKAAEVAERFGLLQVLGERIDSLTQQHINTVLYARPFMRQADVYVFDNITPCFVNGADVTPPDTGLVIYTAACLGNACTGDGGTPAGAAGFYQVSPTQKYAVLADYTVRQTGTIQEITARPQSVNVIKAVNPAAEFYQTVDGTLNFIHGIYKDKTVIKCKDYPSLAFDAKCGQIIT